MIVANKIITLYGRHYVTEITEVFNSQGEKGEKGLSRECECSALENLESEELTISLVDFTLCQTFFEMLFHKIYIFL